MPGRLILAATPIGNTDDASPRLRKALETAEVIAAEDTRRVRDLCRRLGVKPSGEIVAVHDHNERDLADRLVERAGTETVLVVADAGTPAVSDPGFRLVRAAVDAGVEVTVLPGPSAAVAALVVSGLPSDRFCFEGFLPRKAGEKGTALASLSGEARTMVFFESPRRVASTLAAMAKVFGQNRPAAVARELTKTHEEVKRDDLGALAAWADAREILGEVTIVVAGVPAGVADPAALVPEVEARVRDGERLKDAVREVAQAAGVSPKDLYGSVLARRNAPPP